MFCLFWFIWLMSQWRQALKRWINVSFKRVMAKSQEKDNTDILTLFRNKSSCNRGWRFTDFWKALFAPPIIDQTNLDENVTGHWTHIGPGCFSSTAMAPAEPLTLLTEKVWMGCNIKNWMVISSLRTCLLRVQMYCFTMLPLMKPPVCNEQLKNPV